MLQTSVTVHQNLCFLGYPLTSDYCFHSLSFSTEASNWVQWVWNTLGQIFYDLIHWLNMTIPLAPYGGVLSALSVLFDLLALFYVFEERKSLQRIFGNKNRGNKESKNAGSDYANSVIGSNLSELAKGVSSDCGVEAVTVIDWKLEGDLKLEANRTLEKSKVDAALNEPIMDGESLVEYIEKVLSNRREDFEATNKS
jgi:hypothetical protein